MGQAVCSTWWWSLGGLAQRTRLGESEVEVHVAAYTWPRAGGVLGVAERESAPGFQILRATKCGFHTSRCTYLQQVEAESGWSLQSSKSSS